MNEERFYTYIQFRCKKNFKILIDQNLEIMTINFVDATINLGIKYILYDSCKYHDKVCHIFLNKNKTQIQILSCSLKDPKIKNI